MDACISVYFYHHDKHGAWYGEYELESVCAAPQEVHTQESTESDLKSNYPELLLSANWSHLLRVFLTSRTVAIQEDCERSKRTVKDSSLSRFQESHIAGQEFTGITLVRDPHQIWCVVQSVSQVSAQH